MIGVWIAAALAGGCVIGFLACVAYAKATGSRVATETAKLKSDAQKEADQILREARVTAKADVVKLKEAFEDEIRERRKEQLTAEKRLAQKEENLERKESSLDSKVRSIEKKEHDIELTRERLSGKAGVPAGRESAYRRAAGCRYECPPNQVPHRRFLPVRNHAYRKMLYIVRCYICNNNRP